MLQSRELVPKLRLGSLGFLGLDPVGVLFKPAGQVSAPGDSFRYNLAVPPNPGRVGATVFAQGISIGPGGARFTNVFEEAVQERVRWTLLTPLAIRNQPMVRCGTASSFQSTQY